MEDKEQVVNSVESSPTSAVSTQEAEDTATDIGDQETTQEVSTPQQGKADDDTDDRGISWKNRAMELQRKLNDTVDRLPQIVEDTVSKIKHQPQAEREYTIEELEQIAINNPNLRPQAEAEKFKILQKRFEQTTDERIKAVDRKRQDETLKTQAEQWVVTHPEFKECFTSDVFGRKQWNMTHPLSQIVSTYLGEPDIRNRPDGIAIAAKLAYSDYAMSVKNQSGKKANAIKGELRTLQKKTLVEGGTTSSSGNSDALTKARQNLAKTGSKQDAQDAIKAYLKKAGHI